MILPTGNLLLYQNSIYKIYAAVLLKRLGWCIDNKVISSRQKGFLSYEGCCEHFFLMNSLFEDSKRQCRDLRIVWFDLRNAFGTVSHLLLFDMLDRLGIPSNFINTCKKIYSNSKFTVFLTLFLRALESNKAVL